MERTISIIKPDAIFRNLVGVIISRFESAGFMIIAIKMLWLTRRQVEEFYCEHKEKVFFEELVDYVISGPVIVQVLEGKDVIYRAREIIGATNPKEALPGTIRSDYAESCTRNTVHGSDSSKSAIREISYFFNKDEICDRVFLSSNLNGNIST